MAEIAASNKERVALVTQLLHSGKAAAGYDWVLIPDRHLDDKSRALLQDVKQQIHTLPHIRAIAAHTLDHLAAGTDSDKSLWHKAPYIGSKPPYPKHIPASQRPKIPATPLPERWWERDPREAAKQMITYADPIPPSDTERLSYMEKHNGDGRGRCIDTQLLLTDKDRAVKEGIDHERLGLAVGYVKELCREHHLCEPQRMVSSLDSSCADYQRINISARSLARLTPRALKAEMAHVLLNHTLGSAYFNPDYPPGRPSNMALQRQVEKEADMLGIILGRDPLGFVQWGIEDARHSMERAKAGGPQWQSRTGRMATALETLNNGNPQDYHPSTRSRIHLAREMAAQRDAIMGATR